jgi:hypothetical protein
MLSLSQAKQTLNGMDNWRGDCLDCGGKNTLSISNVMGEIKWFCFKAHCETKGRGDVRRTINEIVDAIRRKNRELIRIPFETPPHFTDMNSTPRSIRFFNFLTAIGMKDRVECRYDPKQDRAVFLIRRGLHVVDAIGRSLNRAPPGYASMALLGTNLTTLDIKDLMEYNNIIVALDPDAHSKGVAMASRLDAYSNAKAMLISNDLKYFNPDEIGEILND